MITIFKMMMEESDSRRWLGMDSCFRFKSWKSKKTFLDLKIGQKIKVKITKIDRQLTDICVPPIPRGSLR